MGKVTWFCYLANHVHSALCIPHFTFRIPHFRILPIPYKHWLTLVVVSNNLLVTLVIQQRQNANPNHYLNVGVKLNSTTQLTTPKEEWINKRKEAKKLIYIPDSLVNSQDVS